MAPLELQGEAAEFSVLDLPLWRKATSNGSWAQARSVENWPKGPELRELERDVREIERSGLEKSRSREGGLDLQKALLDT